MEHLTVLDEQHPSGVAGGLDGVGDHEDGLTLAVDLAEQVQQLIGGAAVQGPGGLVGQDQTGMGDQRPGHGGPLLLAAGHLVGILVQQLQDAQLAGDGVQPGLQLPIGPPGQHQGQVDVVPQGEGVQQVELLEHEAQVVPAEGRGVGLPDGGHVVVMGMFFLLNYGLLVTAKLLVGASHPFMFPNGGWRILITVWLVELVILGLLLANRSIRNALKLQQEAAALQKENNTARYTALQNQLNPHFLFNSLNTLISEIRYNPANAELFTQHLSDVYRYTLQCQNQRLTTLREELDFLNSYVFLHRVRLGDCIYIDNRIPESCLGCQLPPLTIQLLAENVIKHNVIHMGKPMTIKLIYMEKEKELVVRNRIQAKKSATAFGTGLKNLSVRYKLLCGRDIVIENDSQEFTVKIPLLYE